MNMDERIVGKQLLSDVIGIDIVILLNDYKEFPGIDGDVLSNQEIVFQIKEENPDYLAIGELFSLSLMSFTFAAPRRVSENYFVPDEEWNLGYFVKGLKFKRKNLCCTSNYVSARSLSVLQ